MHRMVNEHLIDGPCTLLAHIGHTPLIQLPPFDFKAEQFIWAKCEFLNPTGSIKDRIVAYIVEQAEKRHQLKSGDILIESTSGNTGAAVAMIAALKGYRAVLTIPDRVSQEKQSMLRALNATVHVMPSQVSIKSPQHYVNVAKTLSQTLPNSFYINQYHNKENINAHYHTTGPEIWSQMQGNLDVFVSVAGSGGTISGIGRYLKEKNSEIRVIALDPVGSVYHSLFTDKKLPKVDQIFASKVEGAGEDHMTEAIDFSVIDEVMQFQDKVAFETAEKLTKRGIIAGPSSGANVWGALQVMKNAKRPIRIATILPDHGMKYVSKLYNSHWLSKNL